jgi:1-acyl-sn-glycerol-3-phosphate acyltransferase
VSRSPLVAAPGARTPPSSALSGWLPLPLRRLSDEIDERVARIPTRLNEYGYDPFGFRPEFVRPITFATAVIYRYWFRAETVGLENVPEGRVLLIANHAGNTFAWDGAMLATSLFLEAEPPRMVRGMGEYWLPQIPWFNILLHRAGSVVGTPANCLNLLEHEEAVMVFPEGERGFVKTLNQRYELQRFGLGFMRLALESDTPIVPVGIVGGEEQSPGLLRSRALGRLIGAPVAPITWTMLALGPIGGMLPLPVKYRIHVGEPLRFEGDPTDDDAHIEAKVEVVKDAIRALVARGLEARSSWFT